MYLTTDLDYNDSQCKKQRASARLSGKKNLFPLILLVMLLVTLIIIIF